jgi:L-seryl-tRNA(Ser) seleniumtransferase
MATTRNPFRDLPSVDRVLAHERVRTLSAEYAGDTVVALVREELAGLRRALVRGERPPKLDAIAEAVDRRARSMLAPTLRPAINATGVIIHTNLGRAPLSDEALAAMTAVARGYSNLEFDLEEGERGSRHVHLEEQLRRLTGAEAGLVVNNNASALLLTLSALAAHREVVISRGELVEIGGGFRIPEVMAESDAFLVEVGTTNRTYLRDYEAALSEHTAAIMRVHASNFKVVGFTASVDAGELATLAHKQDLWLIDDLGSGCLLDTRPLGWRRSRRRAKAWRRARTWRCSRATSCWAGRRPGSSRAGRSWWSGCGGTRWRARCGRTRRASRGWRRR